MKRFQLLFFVFHLFIASINGQDLGFVLIKSDPSGAVVVIGGKDKGETTPYQKSMPAGTYNFELKLNEYNTYKGQFIIRPNETNTIDIRMVPAFGSLEINTVPTGVRVFLDNTLIGTAPLKKEHIASGKHKLRLEMQMFNPLEDIITIYDEKITVKEYELSAGFGTIGIITIPEADIYVDGKKLGNKLYSGRIASGTHIVEARREKYYTQQRTVTVKEGDETKASFKLQPITGNISVMTDPPEAAVVIEEKPATGTQSVSAQAARYTGTTPRVFTDLIIGQYTFEITKDGYAPIRKNISIEENKTLEINETLFEGVLVTVKTLPEGAEVWVDGLKTGISPIYTPIKQGNHTIEARNKEFFYNSKREVKITRNGQEVIVEMNPRYARLFISSIPKKAFYTINGTGYRGITNDTISRIQNGNYTLQLNKKGFKPVTEVIKLNQSDYTASFTLVPKTFRKKGNALIYSALLPGAGQSYLTRGKPWWLVGGAFYGMLYGSVTLNKKAVDSYDAYLESTNIDERKLLKTDWEKNHKNSQYLTYAAAGVWAVNMIWTLAMPSEEKKFRKLGLTGYDYINSKTIGMGLSYKF